MFSKLSSFSVKLSFSHFVAVMSLMHLQHASDNLQMHFEHKHTKYGLSGCMIGKGSSQTEDSASGASCYSNFSALVLPPSYHSAHSNARLLFDNYIKWADTNFVRAHPDVLSGGQQLQPDSGNVNPASELHRIPGCLFFFSFTI